MIKTKPDREYDVVALQIPIVYNKYGYHDHDGMLFALAKNASALKKIREDFAKRKADPNYYHANLHKPHPLVRPLVLRARKGETVKVTLQNEIQGRKVGLHLVSDGYSVLTSDGARVGANPPSLATEPAENHYHKHEYYWECRHEGVFVFHDMGDINGDEDASNAHGLFGALVVEPEEAEWTDSETGEDAFDGLYVDVHPKGKQFATKQKKKGWLEKWPDYYSESGASFREFVIFIHDEGDVKKPHGWWVKDPNHKDRYVIESDKDIIDAHKLVKDPCAVELKCAEPESKAGQHPDHEDSELNPCLCAHVVAHDVDENGDMPAHVMPLSYRSEPMEAREMELWHRIWKNKKLPCPNVVNEEQHHSSWFFGDPDTPILKAYIGDPVRIRLVHAGVKETHVYHLHFYQWHHVPYNINTPILDSITISPQTGHTIVPLWGAGGPHGVAADVIWHCHLYPHFHQGMWGLFRTFDRCHLAEPSAQTDPNDFSNHYPDGAPIHKLQPLPDREAPPVASKTQPGFPGFMVDPDGQAKSCDHRGGLAGYKSPLPPWPYAINQDHADEVKAAIGLSLIIKAMPADLEYRPATIPELRQMYQHKEKGSQFNTAPEPAWIFPTFSPHIDTRGKQLKRKWFEVDVKTEKVIYNQHGYHDDFGHFYSHAASGDGNHPHEFSQVINAPGNARCNCSEATITPDSVSTKPYCDHEEAAVRQEKVDQADGQRHVPLFLRANKGDFLTLTLTNTLPLTFDCNPFDMRQPRCDTLGTPTAECGMHVHLVKFDVLTADGASSGWNYMSGPTPGKRMIYKWQVDEEFGVCFFHDHCFANYRQRHGLFAALIAEPENAVVVDPADHNKEIRHGIEAVVKYPDAKGNINWFREFCFGLQDFVPLYDSEHHPLHKPAIPGDHGDNGWIAMNYRCEPLLERKQADGEYADPAEWFSTKTLGKGKNISTDIFQTYPGEPIRLRLVQGSHEEQHSFQIHGMRWRRFRNEPASPWRNQQTLGISEAFTFNIAHQDEANTYYHPGDYLWKSTASDDLWCGVWGYISALPDKSDKLPPLPIANTARPLVPPPVKQRRQFKVKASQQELIYRPAYKGKPKLHDPNGLVFSLVKIIEPDGKEININQSSVIEPLVLRCRVGEWVEIELENCIKDKLIPEPWSPLSPEETEETDNDANTAEPPKVKRIVSQRVSMHADLLTYDINQADGSNAGKNADQTVAPGEKINYLWYADVAGPVLLQDMADVKNHRHHGLIGAIIVEPEGVEPYAVKPGESTATGHDHAWHGSRVSLLMNNGTRKEEKVLLLQDGLRLFWESDDPKKPYKNPMRDLPADPGEEAPDFEDQGNKAINYRCEPLGQFLKLREKPESEFTKAWRQWLKTICGWLKIFGISCSAESAQTIEHLESAFATPLMIAPKEADIVLHLVGACDKGRNHSFTVHAHAWEEWSGLSHTPVIGAAGGISGGLAQTLHLQATQLEKADYAVRSGVYRWALNEGVWGIIKRV